VGPLAHIFFQAHFDKMLFFPRLSAGLANFGYSQHKMHLLKRITNCQLN
jgi:hypothetical protein